MKKVEGLKMRRIGKEYMIIPEGAKLMDFNKMVSFNSSAAYLWESVGDKDFTVSDLAGLLIDKYGIDESIASTDAASIAAKWLEEGLVTE